MGLDEYPLLTQKKADYLLFKQAIGVINNKEHLNSAFAPACAGAGQGEGILKLVSIRSSLNLGLTNILKDSFPSIIPEPRPLVLNNENVDKIWLIGFIEGEGCFFIDIFKRQRRLKHIK